MNPLCNVGYYAGIAMENAPKVLYMQSFRIPAGAIKPCKHAREACFSLPLSHFLAPPRTPQLTADVKRGRLNRCKLVRRQPAFSVGTDVGIIRKICGYRKTNLSGAQAHGTHNQRNRRPEPTDKPYKLADGSGLCLLVPPSGAKPSRGEESSESQTPERIQVILSMLPGIRGLYSSAKLC